MQWHYECNGIMNKLNKHVLYIQLHLNLIRIKHVPGAGSTLVQVQAQCSCYVAKFCLPLVSIRTLLQTGGNKRTRALGPR